MRTEISETKPARILAFSVAFILTLIPFHAFITSWAANNFGHLDALRLWKEFIFVLILPFVLFIVTRDKPTRQFFKKSPVVRLFGLYILLHIIMAAWALHTGEVNKKAVAYSFVVNLRFIGFFLVATIAAAHSEWLKENSLKILLLPAVAVIIIGLLQKLTMSHNLLGYFYGKGTIPPYQTIDGNEHLRRVQSTLRGANPLGTYLVLAIASTSALIQRGWRRLIVMLAAFIVLFYSYSRGAWLGTIITLWLLSWWTLLKTHHKTWLITSVAAVVVIAVGGFYLLRSQPVAQDTLLHTSSHSRSKISSNAAHRSSLINGLSDIIHQPLGGGPGTAGPASFRNKPHQTRIAENYYLQIGQEVGVIGMAIFVAINIFVAKLLWAKRDDVLSKVLLASFIGISLINMLSHAWTDDTIAYLWWGMAGICLAPAIISGRHKQNNAKKIKNKS